MSDHAHSAPRRASFGRVVGLILLLLIAALVGLYFYSVEARRAGDEAIGQARSYQRTIVADYKRFYECMRGGGATVASAGSAREESGGGGTARGAGPASAPNAGASPSPGGVAPSMAVDAAAGSVADAPGAAAGEMSARSGPAESAAPGPSVAADSAPPSGLVVYPPYPDYPAYPQHADQSAVRRYGAQAEPPPGQYQPPQAEARAYGFPPYGAPAGYARGPEYAQPPATALAPPTAGQPAGGMQTAPGMNMPQAQPQQPGPGLQAGNAGQTAPAMPAQDAAPASGNYPYPYAEAPHWPMPGAPSYGAHAAPPTAQGPQPQVDNRSYSYPSYGGYPYYQQRAPVYAPPAYPDQQAAAMPPPAMTMQPGSATQPRMQPQTQSAQGMQPWQVAPQPWQRAPRQWQGVPPWQGMQPGPGTQAPWQGMQPNAAMQPGVGMQAPAAVQRQSAMDGNPPYGSGAQYAQGANWQAPGMAYGARPELRPGAPPSVRYDQLSASAPPPGVPVMQGAASARQDDLPGQAPSAVGGGAAPSYSAAPQQGAAAGSPPAPMQAAPYTAPSMVAPYSPASAYAPPPQWNAGAAQAPAPVPAQPAPAVGAEMNPLMSSARQAYASQHYQDAINSYRTLIAKGDDSPAVFGELGNVLLAAGRPQEAAQAYYEASSRLIDMGQPASVYLLLSHVETYDPLLGAILNRRLASLPRSLN